MSFAHTSTIRTAFTTAGVIAACLISAATQAAAQSRVEFGASVLNLTTGVGNDRDSTVLGVGTGGFGLLNPGVYASVFLGRHVAVSPQLGFLWAKTGETSFHIANVTGQLDYFTRGADRSSPFIFGSAGILESSLDRTTPKVVGAGAGYRARVGDRLTVRLDGRFSHATQGGGNSVGVAVSLGGLFGR